MAYTVIIHLSNEDPMVAEIEDLPKTTDNYVLLTNPRRRDGKALPHVDRQAVQFLFPWHRITYIEVLASRKPREDVIEFFRK